MDLERIFSFFDSNQDKFVEHLKSWIAVKSVSASPELRPECLKMVTIVASELKQLGCKVDVIENPNKLEKLIDGRSIELPPIILASYSVDPNKKTVCLYGHVDVQPAQKTDGWNTEPFEFKIDGDKMIGRGTSDDKGPVLGWICLLKAFKELKIEPPVNLKFVFECMEESGSQGLDVVLKKQKNEFLKDVDFVCITDNTWIGTKKPCLTYGLRGVVPFFLEVSGPEKDLHSGMFGGSVREPMTDLIQILSRLVDGSGTILIPEIMNQVSELTDSEKKQYETIDFDTEAYAKGFGCKISQLTSDSKVSILCKRWRYPSLSIHGIEGAFSESGFKTVIPSKVIGKFSIRTVPNMESEQVEAVVRKYILTLVKELKIQNNVTIKAKNYGPSWLSDIGHPNFRAAFNATKLVHGVEPDMTREGGSIPVTLLLQEITEKSVILIPMGRGDDGAHSQNEKLNISNFISGMKVYAAYVDELGKL